MPTPLRSLRPVLIDVLVAAAFGGFWLSAEAGRLGGDGGPVRVGIILLVVVLVAVGAASPWISVAAVGVLTSAALLFEAATSTGSWPLVVGLVYVAVRTGSRPPGRAGTVLSVLLAGGAAALALRAEGPVVAAALAGLVVLGLAWGHLWRLRRGRKQLLGEQRALEQSLDDAGRELTLITERARIARDVHDIMAQSLSIVLAQADGASKLIGADPERAERSLRVISDVARSSLVEVRILIESIGPSAETLDQPTLRSIPLLLDRFGAAGLPVGFAEDGTRLELTDGQQLAVYRIVQEALTNALRHSGESPDAFVRLLWDTTALLLEISSRGRRGREASVGSGMGVRGMKERAELAGGWLTAEEAGGDAFVVTASIPAPPAAESA